MFAPTEYELVDFGGGRKLERFGAYLLDRPSPAAEAATRERPELWSQAAACFQRTSGDRGVWLPGGDSPRLPECWHIRHGRLVLELKATAVGHLGVFPEQAPNWDWLATQLAAMRRPKVLNLFAYTGAATLTAAGAGAEVTHVDAARNTVAWARRNARLSALSDAPIRWIVDDAATFVRRELKRGNRYEVVVLDPPSYGHGRKGKVWKLAADLTSLLEGCGRLLAEKPHGLLLTCHTAVHDHEKLRDMVLGATRASTSDVNYEPLMLHTSAGRRLASGCLANFCDVNFYDTGS